MSFIDARSLGIDSDEFKECLKSESKKNIVQKDMQEGAEFGIQGTPTFFINGRRVEGAQSFSVFKEIIDEELQDEQ